MKESFQVKENVLLSAAKSIAADSLGENQDLSIHRQAHLNQSLRKEQERTEIIEHEKADLELDAKLDFFTDMVGKDTTKNEESRINKSVYNEERIISHEENIKALNLELKSRGNSSKEILTTLLAKYENEESVSVWVENWKNFLRLQEIAESKFPKEEKIIQRIIDASDFSSETSFKTALTNISKNDDISESTKSEIFTEFKGFEISSVSGLDKELKKVKAQQKEIGRLISEKSSQQKELENEIKAIDQKLESSNLSIPERQKLEAKIKSKSKKLTKTKKSITNLKAKQTKEISLELRENFRAILNPDGSRSIKILPSTFEISLPSNALPFMGKKNIRSINLAFVFRTLANQGMTNKLFTPPLLSGCTPSKAHRNMGHLILKNLGFEDSRIISNSEILQLDKDLNRLKVIAPNESGSTCLNLLGIYNKIDQKINKDRLGSVLNLIRENRRMSDELFRKKLKKSSIIQK